MLLYVRVDIAGEIPGARPTSGGQCDFDETDPAFILWIAEAKAKIEIRHAKRSEPRVRSIRMPTLAQDMVAIVRFNDAFKKVQVFGAKIRFHKTGADFGPDSLSLEQYRTVGALLLCIKNLPPYDRFLMLLHYFGASPPEPLSEVYSILHTPMFADYLETQDESSEARKENEDSQMSLCNVHPDALLDESFPCNPGNDDRGRNSVSLDESPPIA